METNMLIIPGVALGRAILGWVENAFADGKIDFPEWKKLGETVIRMGVPMLALIFGFRMDPGLAAGLVVVFDIFMTKLQSSRKKK